jgi:hypothetical protein
MNDLSDAIADIVRLGQRRGMSPEMIAENIVRMLRERVHKEVKPKRGIGVVSQADLLRGF